MLRVSDEFIIKGVWRLLKRIADSVKTSIADCLEFVFFISYTHFNFNNHTIVRLEIRCLPEGGIRYIYRIEHIDIFLCKRLIYFNRRKLLVLSVGNILYHISDFFSHLLRYCISEVLFQNICYTALAGLAVDSDNIRLVFSSHILRIDRQIRHSPFVQLLVLSPFHTLGDSILVRTRERREHQLTAIRLSRVHLEVSVLFINLHNFRHIGEIKLRIHAVGEKVHCQCDDIHVTCSLAVSEEGSLYPVTACQQPQLGISHSSSSVIVRVQRYYEVFPVMKILAHIFNLRCINVRHRHCHCSREIDNNLVFRCRLPYIDNFVADFSCKFNFCTCEALRRILK